MLERVLPGNVMHGHTQATVAAYMGNLVYFETRYEHITQVILFPQDVHIVTYIILAKSVEGLRVHWLSPSSFISFKCIAYRLNSGLNCLQYSRWTQDSIIGQHFKYPLSENRQNFPVAWGWFCKILFTPLYNVSSLHFFDINFTY